jgi:3-oxoacyl-(acyl-carrier-protein) synthase
MRDALDEAGLAPSEIGLVHLSRNGSPFTDAAEDAALADVFGAKRPRTMAVKDSLGENPAIGAIQVALAAAELRADPGTGAILIDAFGAGGNVLAAVLTTP